MSAYMYDEAVAAFTLGELDWNNDDIRVMLVTDAYEPDQALHGSRADLEGYELEASGSYGRGGTGLAARSVGRSDIGEVLLRAGSVSWANVTGRFRYAVLYQANGSRGDDRLIAYADLGRQEATNATVSLEYGRDGVAGFLVASPTTL